MNVVFSNPGHPEYGVATIPFPIPKADYGNCLFTLTALDIGNVLTADCKVEEISEDSPVFQRLVGSAVNVDELDYLVKRMDSFDKRELAQFHAVAISQNFHEVKDLINLTFCCQNVPIVQDFTDLQKVGQHCYMVKNGGAMTMEDAQSIDFKKEALKLLLNEEGKVTQYGVIYDEGFALEQLYEGRRFPQYRYEDCVMEVEVTTAKEIAENITPVCHALPMSAMQLERAMQRDGFADGEELELRFMESNLPVEVDVLLDFESESLADLNAMCQAAADFTAEDYAKLGAAARFTKPATATALQNLAQQLDLFDFIPGIQTPQEYGKHMIMESGHFEYDENLAGYYNFEKYGVERMEQEYGEFNERGYISYHGAVSIPELLGGVDCERMDMTMGGMA